MKKFSTSFLGRDCPGVVAAISKLFGEIDCNIIAMTQTRLSGEFAAIFVVEAPENQDGESLKEFLTARFAQAEIDLSVLVRPSIEDPWGADIECEPFVATADGPDEPGLIGTVSNVFGRHGVNIENLTAIMGERTLGQALFVFELMVPVGTDLGRLRRELEHEASKVNLRVSVLHRAIYEAVHRLPSF